MHIFYKFKRFSRRQTTDRNGGGSGSSRASQALEADSREHQVRDSEESSSTSICKKINDSVYELHMPSTTKAKMDILFFHGLQLEGNSEAHISTWRSRSADGAVWPRQWLPEDFPNARVLTISYDGSMNQTDTRGRMDLYLVAESLLTAVLSADVGQAWPVILIGHSFGGLVIKQLCLLAHKKVDLRSHRPYGEIQQSKAFLQHIRAIFYYATPHHGSRFTDVVEKFNMKEGDLVNHVRVFSKDLARLNEDFKDLRDKNFNWQVASVGETLPTDLGGGVRDIIVEEASARCENFTPVGEDHISICQPRGKDSSTYQLLVDVIHKVQLEVMKETSCRSDRQTLSKRQVGSTSSLPGGEIHQGHEELSARAETSRKSYYYPLSTIEGFKTYVPVHGLARDRIVKALEDKAGPAVILLHGDPGTGKSTLARYIGQCYAESCQVSTESRRTSLIDPSIHTKFVVFLLVCGRYADVSLKLQEFRQTITHITDDQRYQQYEQTECTLQDLPTETDILTILDDVWDPEFVEACVLFARGDPGRNVRFLVTSRISTLYDQAFPVETQEVSLADAEKILASHAGLTAIPQNLQEHARNLVQKSGKNPLALAMVAKRITRKRKEDAEQWKGIAESYTDLLRENLEAKGVFYGSVLDCAYKRSIGETLMLTYRDLQSDAKHLLNIIAMCEGAAVPSHVVYMLYEYLGNPALFRLRRNELQDSGTMLRLTKEFAIWVLPCMTTGVDFAESEYETLALHDLQKEFLNLLMKADIKCLIEFLVDIPDSTPPSVRKITSHGDLCQTTILALSVLYLRKEFAEIAAGKLGVSCPLRNSIPMLRDALEPLVCLMQVDLYDEDIIRCAKQVLVKFVWNGGLDDRSLSRLLTSPVSGTMTAATLLRILHYMHTVLPLPDGQCALLPTQADDRNLSIWRVPSLSGTRRTSKLLRRLLGEKYLRELQQFHDLGPCSSCAIVPERFEDNLSAHGPETIESLLPYIRKKFDESCPIQNLALPVLMVLASLNVANRKMISETPDFFEDCLRLFFSSENSLFRYGVATTLSSLTCGDVDVESEARSRRRIGSILRLLPAAITTLLTSASVLSLLLRLCKDKANMKQIVDSPGALEELIRLLSNSRLQTCAAGILWHVCEVPEVPTKIAEIPGAISQLLNCISEDDSPVLQEFGCIIMYHVFRIEANSKRIEEVPGALEELIRLLSVGDSDVFQGLVGAILFALFENPEIQRSIKDIPHAISKLLTWISKDDNLPSQFTAEDVFDLLSSTKHCCEQIVEVPGAVEDLLGLLIDGKSSGLQIVIAEKLIVLLRGNEDINKSFGEDPEVIRKLLSLLLKNDSFLLQDNVSLILCLLITVENKKLFLDFPGICIVEGLVRLVLRDESSIQLQHNIAAMLGMLAADSDISRRILEIRGAISALVTCILIEEHLPFQERSTYLLFDLSRFEATRKYFLESPGAVEELVRFLVSSTSTRLQYHLAGTLMNISESMNSGDIQKRIAEIPAAVSKLLTLLSYEHSLFTLENVRLSTLVRTLSSQEANKKLFLEFPGPVEGLVRLLLEHPSTDIQNDVAEILVQILGVTSDIGMQRRVEEISKSISNLLTLLSKTQFPPLQINVSCLLEFLSKFEVSKKLFLELPGAVGDLVRLLLSSDRADLQGNVAGILENLLEDNSDIQGQIGEIPDVISKLLTILFDKDVLPLRCSICSLLFHLLSMDDNKKRLLRLPGASERLVELLLDHKISSNSKLPAGERLAHTQDTESVNQRRDEENSDAISRMENLVAAILVHMLLQNPEIRVTVGEIPKAISKMLTLLFQKDFLPLQMNLSSMLYFLATVEANQERILMFPGVVQELVRLLLKDESSTMLSRNVGEILLSLRGESSTIQRIVGEIPGAISKLLTWIFEENEDDTFLSLQASSAGLLFVLSELEYNTKHILEYPGAEEELLRLLLSSKSRSFRLLIAGILDNLSKCNSHFQRRIEDIPKVISKLLTCISKDNSLRLQDTICTNLVLLVLHRAQILEMLEEAIIVLSEGTDHELQIFVAEILEKSAHIRSWIGEIPVAISKMLMGISRDHNPRLQVTICKTLAHLSNIEANRTQIVADPRALEEFIRLLSEDNSTEVQALVAEILVNVSKNRSDVQYRIGEIPEAISKMLWCLSKGENLQLQENVSEILSRTSKVEANAKRIVEVPGAVEDLIRILLEDNSFRLQAHIAGTLFYVLSYSPDIVKSLGNIPEVIAKLLTCTLKNDRSLGVYFSFLLHSLFALETNRKQMQDPDIVEKLVRLVLSDQSSTGLRQSIAAIFGEISLQDSVVSRIGQIPGAISKLVTCVLFEGNFRHLQVSSHALLFDLSRLEATKQHFLDSPGTVEGLVRLLLSSTSSWLQYYVAGTLMTISVGSPQIQRRIGEIPGTISKLLCLLLNDDSLLPQAAANVSVLLKLSLGTLEANREPFPEVCGAVEGLWNLLFRHKNACVQSNAAGILVDMLSRNSDIQRRIGKIPQAILSLLTCLFVTVSPGLQVNVSRILFQLAKIEANEKHFMKFPDIVQELLRILLSDTSSISLQESLTCLLSMLSRSEVTRKHLLEFPASVEKLLRLFLTYDHPTVLPSQDEVATMLAHLSSGDDQTQKGYGDVPEATPTVQTLNFVQGRNSSTEESVKVVLFNLATILCHLSSGDERTKRRFADVHEAIPKLLNFLLKDDYSSTLVDSCIKESVSEILYNLSREETNRKQMMKIPDFGQKLMAVCCREVNFVIRQQLVRLIVIIACDDNADRSPDGEPWDSCKLEASVEFAGNSVFLFEDEI